MAEVILAAAAKEVLRRLSSLAVQEIGLAWGVKSDLKKLESTLSAISAVLLDAEKQQTKNHAVRDWLEKLKDVVYDIDDVLDDFTTEALRRDVKMKWSMFKEVRNFFSSSNPLLFRTKIGHKIKMIRERLDDISLDRRNFMFIEQIVETRVQTRMREGTHSFVRESEVIGRDEDRENIVEFLLNSTGNENDLSVVSVVGLGGIGKTTLAKLVYNDVRISGNFELKMWVCVSDDFDLKNLLEKIISSATGANYGNLGLDELQICLRDNLGAKKFLLVLDDVWNEDRSKWIELKNLLMDSAGGSRILVTTRSTKVALIMDTIPPYDLRGLSNDECLSILVRCAFKEGHEKEHPKLVEIGKGIVNKCGGIPLAAKTLGCLLCSKYEEEEWSYVRDNEIWTIEQKENDILPALRLSYDHLPSYLKPCFAYCCIFPKDQEMIKDDLISRWMAQGFLHLPNDSRQLEDIGYQYFSELLSRSFFQDAIVLFDSEIYSCKMHDIVHDLGRSVLDTECLEMDLNSEEVSSRVRHILFVEDDLSDEEFPVSLLNTRKVRSFLAHDVELLSIKFLGTLSSTFRYLRVLDLVDSQFEVLPSSICKLKHLRYLNLLGNYNIKALPNSICKLLNLQTLYLFECEQLQDLPRDVGKLISLRYLNLTSKLTCLPEKGLEGLTSLRYLWLFQCNHLASLSEGVQYLTSLRVLLIHECPMLASLPSGMKYLTALEKLVIRDCRELHLLEGEDLQGLKSLKSLSIIKLPKLVSLPRGLQQSAATLQYLSIRHCTGMTALPDWIQTFDSLRVLYINNCPNVLLLPEGMQRLTVLRELGISGCPHLVRRCEKETGEDWLKISHIPQVHTS